MDQCDDCSEVVCASCSTLLSCKFCGGGLCEECATACGRCGIVLCARDAKFAVECDTCKLSYCLVCLASGTKDPCVRCGHRPSKRVEQLVHLRLKSIYKAFKQSGAHNRSGSSSREDAPLDGDQEGDSDDDCCPPDGGNDVGAVLQAAAAAAAASKPSGGGGSVHDHSHHHAAAVPTSFSSSSNKKHDVDRPSPVERFKVKQAEADAAAAALLAELEEEEIVAEKATKSKKSKKKRKKERQQAKKGDEDPKMQGDENPSPDIEEPAKEEEMTQTKKKLVDEKPDIESDGEKGTDSDDDQKNEEILIPDAMKRDDSDNVDEAEQLLLDMVSESDADGIEALLASLRGIPGRAALRKNVKKALKRLKEAQDAELAAVAEREEKNSFLTPEISLPGAESHAGADIPHQSENSGYKPPEPLLKLVSNTHRPLGQTEGAQRTRSGTAPPLPGIVRAECVMHMAPSVVGWVIGKGGQRIRDLMEESGAKVWIDQDSMGQSEPRIVYVSGNRKAVDTAVRMIKDLVAKAPVGGAGGAPVPPLAPIPTCQTAGFGKQTLASDLDTRTSDTVLVKPSPQTPQPNASMPQSSSMEDSRPAQPHGTVRRTDPAGPFAFSNSEAGGGSSSGAKGNDWDVHEMTCEPRFVPLLIGRRGWTIKHIQDSSGARVDIDQTVTPRVIKISGKAHCVRSAIRMVRDVLSYPHAQLHYHGIPDTEHIGEEPDRKVDVNGKMEPSSEIPPIIPSVLPGVFEGTGQSTLDGEEILKAALEKSLQNEGESAQFSAPPSSLNMKSTISASSSLSSTPEPSMASTTTGQHSLQSNFKHPLSGDRVLHPDYFVQSAVPSNQVFSNREPTEPVADNRNGTRRNIPAAVVNEESHLYPSGLLAMNNAVYPKQQSLPNDPRYVMPMPRSAGHKQSQQQPALQGGPMLPPNVGRLDHGDLGHSQNPPQAQNASSMDFGGMQQQNPQAPIYQPASLLFERGSSAPSQGHGAYQDPMIMPSGDQHMLFGNAPADPWAGEASHTPPNLVSNVGQGPLMNTSVTEGYQQDHLRPPIHQSMGSISSAHAPLGYVGRQGSVENAVADFGYGQHSSAPQTFIPSQEDSDLVDNLFGPPSSRVGTNPDVLGDLQNLSLNGGGGIGDWTSSIPGWGDNGQEDNGGHQRVPEQSASGFQQPPHSTDQPMNQQGQQPSRSRLDWG